MTANNEKNARKGIVANSVSSTGYGDLIVVPHKCNKLAVFLILLVAVVMVSFNALSGVFVVDDIAEVNILPRLLPGLSFKLNHYFAGSRPQPYHIVNIIIHFGNAFLLFLVAFKMLSLKIFSGKYAKSAQKIAFVCALIFAIHPLSIFTSTFTEQRSTLMSSFFFLLSVLTYLNYVSATSEEVEKRNGVVSVICAILAILSKEAALAIIPVFIMIEALLFPRREKRGEDLIFIVFAGALLVVVLFAYLFATLSNNSSGVGLLELLGSTLFYIPMILLPMGKSLSVIYGASYNIPLSPALSVAIVAVLLSVAYFRRRKNPLISFLIFWYVTIAVVEAFAHPFEIISVDRAYLPAVALYFVAAYLIVTLYEKVRSLKKTAILCYPVILVFALAVSYLSNESIRQNDTFKSRVAIWEHAQSVVGENNIVVYKLALSYFDGGMYKKAIEQLTQFLSTNDGHVEARLKLALAHTYMSETTLAQTQFNALLKQNDKYLDAYVGLSELYVKVGRYDYAIRELEKALSIEPGHPRAHEALGDVYFTRGRLKLSLDNYLVAIRYSKPNAYLFYKAAKRYESLRDYKKAYKYYKMTLKADAEFEFADEIRPKFEGLIRDI